MRQYLTFRRIRDRDSYLRIAALRWFQLGARPTLIALLIAAMLPFFAAPASGQTVINNVADLQAMENNLAGDYVLGADIDASGFNFTPIVGPLNAPFTGALDGKGFTISNLTINAGADGSESALFGNLGGTVVNLRLVNIRTSGGFAGTVAALLEGGSIARSSSGGSVIGSNVGGGLVGWNINGTISQSYSTVSVSTSTGEAGGLVGINTGKITQSYATGPVTGGTTAFLGALVGSNSVASSSQFGFVAGSIVECYATGLVAGPSGSSLGGLAGLNQGGLEADGNTYITTIAISYWDTVSTNQTSSVGFFQVNTNNTAVGLTTTQLQSGVLPNGFDPAVWVATQGQYPQLLWQANGLSVPTLTAFPLSGYTPYTVPIITVFDHSMESAHGSGVLGLYHCDNEVLAFTGDAGFFSNGSFGKHAGDPSCNGGLDINHLGYKLDVTRSKDCKGKKNDCDPFILKGVNYKGATGFGDQFFLNYDGHPGYDYHTGGSIPVFAAASGRIFYPLEAVGMTGSSNRAYCFFHTLAEIPDDALSYRIYYLHLSTYPASLRPGATPQCGAKGDTNGDRKAFQPQGGCSYIGSDGKPVPLFLPLPEGTHVLSGCQIAISGEAGVPGSPHLHFEVQQIVPKDPQNPAVQDPKLVCFDESKYVPDPSRVCLPVDPYGWTGTPPACNGPPSQWSDPYQCLTRVPARKLWAQ